jgi:hypothetical protein
MSIWLKELDGLRTETTLNDCWWRYLKAGCRAGFTTQGTEILQGVARALLSKQTLISNNRDMAATITVWLAGCISDGDQMRLGG